MQGSVPLTSCEIIKKYTKVKNLPKWSSHPMFVMKSKILTVSILYSISLLWSPKNFCFKGKLLFFQGGVSVSKYCLDLKLWMRRCNHIFQWYCPPLKKNNNNFSISGGALLVLGSVLLIGIEGVILPRINLRFC